MARGRIVMGLMFFPRGGSAQVVRYLVPALAEAGWPVSLVAGSLGEPGDDTHAGTFFDGIDLQTVDYTDAVRIHAETGASAVAAQVPVHPSFEDRAGAPDVVLSAVDPSLAPHLAAVWEAPLAAAGANSADVLHLHHLTPQHDAAARWCPDVPVLAHLHGTEIKLIEAIEERAMVAAAMGLDLATMPGAAGALSESDQVPEAAREILRTTRWEQWQHGAFWVERLREQAARADHLVTVSPTDLVTALEVLRLEPERVSAIPNGVDLDRFHPTTLSPGERRSAFRRWLVDDPQGWDESGRPGSVSYGEGDVDHFFRDDGDVTVLVFVGRFTAAKRVPLLIRAFAAARPHFARPGLLLVWGGHPGEWEGEHPVTVARDVGEDGVFFAGWRGHHDLPLGLAACDALVMPSVNDSFPQTPLEAMATGLPVLATKSGGFPMMVNLDPAQPTGWLVPPDNHDALADTIVEVVNRPAEVAARGANALAHAEANLSWRSLVPRFESAYAEARRYRRSRR